MYTADFEHDIWYSEDIPDADRELFNTMRAELFPDIDCDAVDWKKIVKEYYPVIPVFGVDYESGRPDSIDVSLIIQWSAYHKQPLENCPLYQSIDAMNSIYFEL